MFHWARFAAKHVDFEKPLRYGASIFANSINYAAFSHLSLREKNYSIHLSWRWKSQIEMDKCEEIISRGNLVFIYTNFYQIPNIGYFSVLVFHEWFVEYRHTIWKWPRARNYRNRIWTKFSRLSWFTEPNMLAKI